MLEERSTISILWSKLHVSSFFFNLFLTFIKSFWVSFLFFVVRNPFLNISTSMKNPNNPLTKHEYDEWGEVIFLNLTFIFLILNRIWNSLNHIAHFTICHLCLHHLKLHLPSHLFYSTYLSTIKEYPFMKLTNTSKIWDNCIRMMILSSVKFLIQLVINLSIIIFVVYFMN